MPRRPTGSVPSLVHHKPSNRARVRINGRDHWLGKWGSPESKLAYDRLIAEYLATRRIMPPTATPTATVSSVVISPASPGVAIDAPSVQSADSDCIPSEHTVAELASLYLEHCRIYYRTPDGKRTSTYDNALQAVRALRAFDDTLASAFGPRKLGMIRDSEATRGRPRVGCNAIVKQVRRLFQWAESQELVPRGTHNSLKTVEPLRHGRTSAPELPPIKPVDDAVVDATLPYLPEIVADMVRLQRLTGGCDGWRVNHKRVERIWREEGLKVPKKQPNRRRLWLNDGSCIRLRPTHRDHVWSYDFVVDRTSDGRPIRMLTVVDEFTRECLAIDVAKRLTSEDVLERLSDLFVHRGVPEHIRSDSRESSPPSVSGSGWGELA
jgi:hypothetical protein